MSALDKVYTSTVVLATDKQRDFIIDNVEWYREDKDQEKLIQRLDKLTKLEASEIISEIIEYKNYAEDDMGVGGYEWWKD